MRGWEVGWAGDAIVAIGGASTEGDCEGGTEGGEGKGETEEKQIQWSKHCNGLVGVWPLSGERGIVTSVLCRIEVCCKAEEALDLKESDSQIGLVR